MAWIQISSFLKWNSKGARVFSLDGFLLHKAEDGQTSDLWPKVIKTSDVERKASGSDTALVPEHHSLHILIITVLLQHYASLWISLVLLRNTDIPALHFLHLNIYKQDTTT